MSAGGLLDTSFSSRPILAVGAKLIVAYDEGTCVSIRVWVAPRMLDLVCIPKIMAVAGALCSLSTAEDGFEIAKDAIEACAKGGEAALAFKEADRKIVRHALDRCQKRLQSGYDKALDSEARDDDRYRQTIDSVFVSVGEVFDRCIPKSGVIAALGLDPEKIARSIADAAVTEKYEEFAENGAGRRILIDLVTTAYGELRNNKHFIEAMQGANWAEAFKRFDRAEEAAERRHRELLSEIAKGKGVEEAPLREVLRKLGEAEVPVTEIPNYLDRAADELVQLRADLARLRNDRPEFAAIRARASALIDRGEFDAARGELRRGREAARALREEFSRSEAGFLLDEARVYRLQLNYDDACAKFTEASRLDPENCWIWIDLGDLWVVRGSLAEAKRSFGYAINAARRNGDERDLSVSYDRVGDVLVAQGNLPEALKSFRDGLAIRDLLAKADPGNALWQRDLAVSHAKIAEACEKAGDTATALDELQQGRAIMAGLTQLSPDNAVWKRDLAWFDRRIAELTR